MRYCISSANPKKSLLLFVFAVTLGLASDAYAQTGSCTSPTGEAFLDVNNVRARITNNGNLFWRGSPAIYEVPKGGGAQAIFTGGVWIGGQVGGQLRTAAARYGNYEFWTGPLDDAGNPPADCSIYDRVWKVSRADVTNLNAGAGPTRDLSEWPTGLGAPTLDANGDPIDLLDQPLSQRINRVIDLAAGERPDVLGDQMLWWINNDRGNTHNETETPPIGVEVHNSAFAFNQAGDIGNATFYKVRIFYRGATALEDAYIALFSDPDLGNFDDDYVGSDSTLGLGYVYNSDDDDEGGGGYGPQPPAAGYDFFQGPIVPSVGDTAKVSTAQVPGFKNLGMTSFMFYNNGGGINEDPQIGSDYYNYMQARWKDGRKVLFGGDGFESNTTTTPTNFMFTGDPVTNGYWTEFNADDMGNANAPADRRFVMSSGPFTINPNDVQEIVYGLAWAKGTSNLDSVTKLLGADRRLQAAYNADFQLPTPPDAPDVKFTELDGQVFIEWDNKPTSNNFLDSYNEFNPLGSPDNPFYEFEGYEIWQFASPQDQTGTLVATYDNPNGITSVIDDIDEDGITELTAKGTDNGIVHAHAISGLTNYKNYYYGVRSYAYNEGSIPKAFYSPFNRFTTVPTKTQLILNDETVAAAGDRSAPDITADLVGIGDGSVTVDIVNPAALRECEYRVEFYSLPEGPSARVAEEGNVIDPVLTQDASVNKSAAGETTYDIFCGSEKVFDGSALDGPAPQRANLLVMDGLEFSIQAPATGWNRFVAVQNGSGAVDPPDCASFGFQGFPHPDNCDNPGDAQQDGEGHWAINAGGGDGGYASFLSRSTRDGNNFVNIGVFDYEMRFTGSSIGWKAFGDGTTFTVPFELWRTGIATPDDPSDDVRLVPILCETACGHPGVDGAYDTAGDHPGSGSDNDPFTDWVYWYGPIDNTPGSAGYDAYVGGDFDQADTEIIARSVLVNWNGGSAPPYNQDLPETGTIFRYITDKPIQPGDIFSFSTVGLGGAEADAATKVTQLDDIGVVPNPYKGASSYEVSQLTDEVRFTNLPDVATIRVFSLNGALIRTLVKNSPGVEYLTWDLTSEDQLPLASGMYLIHVEVPSVGSKVIKFGFVKKRTQLNTF